MTPTALRLSYSMADPQTFSHHARSPLASLYPSVHSRSVPQSCSGPERLRRCQGMGPKIRYMGNKHGLAPEVAALVAEHRSVGPLIDLFCGMCSIGAAVASTGRAVWGNDVQSYAALVARCYLSSRGQPLPSEALSRVLTEPFHKNANALSKRFGRELALENEVLGSPKPLAYQHAVASWPHAGNDAALAREVARLAAAPSRFPFRLCTLSFAWGYFGLHQAIELDSIRYAIDTRRADGALSSDQANWALLGLLEAASISGSGPGHFAQYLRGGTEASVERIVRQRKRSVWNVFLDAADAHQPFGSARWRSRNHVLEHDALEIWPRLDGLKARDAVIYADPPYSKDHYSRYYHVLETLVRYDYPSVTGAGRYRADRFQTPFSLRTSVEPAFERLFEAIADRGFSLVLSYPSNGLLTRVTGVSADTILRRFFRRVSLAFTADVPHSTLGARHGHARAAARELIWIAS